jgi:NRPS condensation-like uncharacterized protein
MVAFAPVPIISSRPLGSGEWLWWHMSRARSVNFVIRARLNGRVSVASLQHALLYVQHRYPILRSRIVMQQGYQRPRLEVLASVAVPLRVLAWQSDDQWTTLVEQELSDGIAPDASPLWRVSLIHAEQHSDLLLTFHHGMSDGLSSIHILEEILSHHAGLRAAAPEQAILPPPYDQLLPPFSLWHTLQHYVTATRRLIKPAPVAQLPVYVRPDSATTTETAIAPYTQLRTFSLDRQQSAQLLQRCKSLNSSMNDFLSGALLRSAAPMLAEHGTQAVSMTSALNVRPLLDPSYHDVVGYYSSGIESRFLLSQNSDLWQLGQQATQLAKAQFSPLHIRFGLWLRQLLIRLKPDPNALLDLLGKGSKASVHLSNMGRIEIANQYGDLTLESVLPIAGVHYAHKPLFCLVSVSFDRRLTVVASFCQPMTGADTADQLFQRFCDQLLYWSNPETP